jgi:3-hydroxybutyryl-CoA dehydrogenase
MTPQKILVIGSGFMGAGIAQVCAQSGYRVHLSDIEPKALERAARDIRWSVEKLSAKGYLQDPPENIIGRISFESDLDCAARADWIIEAVVEDAPLKIDLFKALEKTIPGDTPLASNTSSIPITRIAERLEHPGRVVGLHFFGPVPFMRLVEVVRGKKTREDVFSRGVALVESLGKTPVRVKRDIPGFVMNRIFSAAFREAVDLVADGIVSPEDVDVGMRLGYGWNVGPFEVADNAGIDTFVRVGKSMRALGEENLVTRSDLLEKMIQQGRLGKKVGKGFYRYEADGSKVPYQEK